ncbi:hypothetical protein [Lacrimispora sp.]|jgi:glucan-binding YG repeat protein|uniref:hypothetical protein n=1 Tax=Lacrimispora sp. TaxID=2719234 RepID=UPI0028A8EE29|nr:hypothetical protein [Lacrimispora sp.]
MKKVVTLLLMTSIMFIMAINVYAENTSPIPWTEDIQDIPFSQGTDRNGQEGWRYYKQGEGLVTNRWVQNYKYDWYYCGEEGFLLKSTWLHDPTDGKYYYLGDDWIMLHNTTTPDGYTVGSDGAWIRDGQVVVEISAESK